MQLSGVNSSIHAASGVSSSRSRQNCFYNESEDRLALSSVSHESVLGETWAETLVDAFMHAGYPVENDSRIVARVIEYARELWTSRVTWDSLKWYVRNKAIYGARAYFAGIFVVLEHEVPTIAGFTSGYPAAYLVDPEGGIRELVRPVSHNNMDFWSGYSPGSGVRKKVSPENDPYFICHLKKGSTFILLSYEIAEWVHNSGPESIRSLLESSDPSVLIKNLIRKGSIGNSDSVVCIVRAE